MCNPKIIFRMAGVMILLSVLLGYTVHYYWFGLAAFVGANLLQSSFTGFCPAERILGHFGLFGCTPKMQGPARTS